MAHYVIAPRDNDVYAVTRFSDNDIPDHIGVLDYKKETLNFNFFHKVTQSTLDKYMRMVKKFIDDGKPECTVYFASDDEPSQISSYCYGPLPKAKPRVRKKK